jgi:hypothetical protein
LSSLKTQLHGEIAKLPRLVATRLVRDQLEAQGYGDMEEATPMMLRRHERGRTAATDSFAGHDLAAGRRRIGVARGWLRHTLKRDRCDGQDSEQQLGRHG